MDRRERFERLYAEFGPRVLAYALRRSDREEARDVTAEVFTVAWRKIDAVPDDERALPWLLVTARNVLANRWRKTREVLGEPTPAPAADHAESVAGTVALATAFGRLSPEERETLALIAWDGLSPREAATVAGCSAATFSVRLHRARRSLAALLEDGSPAAAAPEGSR